MRITLRGFIFCILAVLPFTGIAQSSSEPPVSYILVVPFNSQMYKNPADHLICKSSDLNPGELNDLIRRSITATIIQNLSEFYHTTAVKSENLQDPRSDLSMIYGAIAYKSKKRKLVGFHKGYPPFKFKQLLAPRRVRWGSDCVGNDFKKPFARRQYMEAYVKNDSLFSKVMADNKSAYVVLVNQFEMYTRFKSCLDLQRNVFERDMYIHFTLLDSSGKRLNGGVVGTTWQGNSNDIEVIFEKNLATLCGFIIDIVRKEI
jgi:hypothetical protein